MATHDWTDTLLLCDVKYIDRPGHYCNQFVKSRKLKSIEGQVIDADLHRSAAAISGD